MSLKISQQLKGSTSGFAVVSSSHAAHHYPPHHRFFLLPSPTPLRLLICVGPVVGLIKLADSLRGIKHRTIWLLVLRADGAVDGYAETNMIFWFQPGSLQVFLSMRHPTILFLQVEGWGGFIIYDQPYSEFQGRY